MVYGYRKLNPYNWFLGSPSTTAEAAFLDRQSKINTYDDRFYPFTNINPYAPWWERLRMQIFGESLAEINERMIDKDFAMRDYLAIAVDKTAKGSQTPVSTDTLTPNIAALGIKNVSGSSFMDAIEASTSYLQTEAKLEDILPGTSDWVVHIVDKANLDVYRNKFKDKGDN